MKRMAFGALIAIFAAGALAACNDSDSDDDASPDVPTVSDPTAEVRELANEFFQILHDEDMDALDAFLSPALQLQRADGSMLDKASYLENPATVTEWELSGFQGTHTGSVLVGTYEVVTTEEIDGQPFATAPAPRISTFVWSESAERWQLVAHANFNVPEND